MGPLARTFEFAPPVEFDWIGPIPQLVVAHTANAIIRRYVAELDDVDKQKRSVTATINTGSVDRYKTVIEPDGIDLTAYRSNPVVLWEHGKDPQRGSLPIGRNLWIKSGGGSGNGALIAKTIFAKDDYSQTLFEMYQDGTLRGWSVNILPDTKRCSPPTKDEVRSRPELADCVMMYRSGELAEYSGVAVPGNAETLTMLEERGIWCPRMMESSGLASGGAAVGPAAVLPDNMGLPRKKRKKRKDKTSDDVESAMAKPDTSTPADIESAMETDAIPTGNPEPTSVQITKSQHWISDDGVMSPDGSLIVRTTDPIIAQLCIEQLGQCRSFADEFTDLLNRTRAWQEQMKRDALAMVDLMVHGRV